MKFQELYEEITLNEDAVLVKFKYDNFKQDPNPKVKVLDFEYPGQKGQKSYGKRSDVLGFNVNYYENKKYAMRAIDEIDSFARLLSANKEEKYKRIKYFFPDALPLLRRYNKTYIKNLKTKNGEDWFFSKTEINDLINKDKENL